MNLPWINLIIIEDSSYCNMNCSYCPHWKADNEKEVLSASNLLKIYQFANSLPHQLELLHLYTEPLLNWDNIQIATKNFYFTNGVHKLYTNGLLLDSEKINYLLSHNIQISVSFDGLFQDNRLPNTFSLLDNLCKQHPYCFKIMCTVPKTSVPEFQENIKYFKQLPVKNVSLTPNYNDNWTKEDLTNFYQPLIKNFTNAEKEKFCLNNITLSHPLLSPQAHRKNALLFKTNGDIYQYLTNYNQQYVGRIENLDELTIPDYSIINFENDKMDCKTCPLIKNCQRSDNAITLKVGSVACIFRQVLYDLKESL